MASTEHPHEHHLFVDPDMRYLPMFTISIYSLKHTGLNGNGVKRVSARKSAVIDLPPISIVFRIIAGQVVFVTTLTSTHSHAIIPYDDP